jgi:hypothetical protein
LRRPRNADASRLTRAYARTILKPLTRREAATATGLALQAILREAGLRRDRVRIHGPFLRVEKPTSRDGAPRRVIWVRVRDRDKGVVHEMFFEAGKLVEHKIDPHANPPFSDEEREEARGLILNDRALANLLSRKDVEIDWFNPGGHGGGRVIGARILRVEHHQHVEHLTDAEVELDQGVLRARRAPR